MSEILLRAQIGIVQCWLQAGHAVDAGRRRVREDRDRGEVTATTALIVILVVAAIAAAGIIAGKMRDNANNVPLAPTGG